MWDLFITRISWALLINVQHINFCISTCILRNQGHFVVSPVFSLSDFLKYIFHKKNVWDQFLYTYIYIHVHRIELWTRTIPTAIFQNPETINCKIRSKLIGKVKLYLWSVVKNTCTSNEESSQNKLIYLLPWNPCCWQLLAIELVYCLFSVIVCLWIVYVNTQQTEAEQCEISHFYFANVGNKKKSYVLHSFSVLLSNRGFSLCINQGVNLWP